MDKENICPVCLEGTGTLLILSCDHCIHLICAEGLTSVTCPFCRSKITNWPEYLYKIINKNWEKRQKEIEDEREQDTRDFLENEENWVAVGSIEVSYEGSHVYVNPDWWYVP